MLSHVASVTEDIEENLDERSQLIHKQTRDVMLFKAALLQWRLATFFVGIWGNVSESDSKMPVIIRFLRRGGPLWLNLFEFSFVGGLNGLQRKELLPITKICVCLELSLQLRSILRRNCKRWCAAQSIQATSGVFREVYLYLRTYGFDLRNQTIRKVPWCVQKTGLWSRWSVYYFVTIR